MTYYHHVDDSGDPGLSDAPTASSHFALAMVQLAERAPLPEFAALRQALHLEPAFEFKYHKAKPHQKTVFFKVIQTVSFRVRAVVVDKTRLEKRFADLRGQDFAVEFLSRLALRASDMEVANDILVIDGATPALIRALRVRLSEDCRAMERVRPFKKIVGGDSSREDGLQLADMLAGAIRHHVMGVERDHYPTFVSKVVDLWEAPEK